jgi:hypothetical protein
MDFNLRESEAVVESKSAHALGSLADLPLLAVTQPKR